LNIWLSSIVILLSITIIGYSFNDAFAGVGPSIEVTKTVDKPIVIAGTEVKYTYTVENTGDRTLSCSTLIDDKLGTIANINANIAPNDTPLVFMQSTTINVDTDNTATITCLFEGPDGLTQIQDTDSESVDVVNPQTTVDKSVSKNTVIDGQSVTYNISVFNGGDIDLENCVLIDTAIGFNSVPFAVAQGATVDFFNFVVQIFTPGLDNTANLTCSVPTTMGDTHVDSSNQVIVTVVDIGAPTIDKAS